MTRSRSRSRPLTPDELFERALAIVDEHGLEALTMRRLAADVGVEAASLYHHIPNKRALVDGALALMRSQMRVPDSASGDWMGDMEVILTEYRRVLVAHPNMMSLAGRRLGGDDESGLDYLMSQGFDEDAAVELLQSLIAFVVGFSMFSTRHVETGEVGLSPTAGARMVEWRDATFAQTLRAIMESFEGRRR